MKQSTILFLLVCFNACSLFAQDEQVELNKKAAALYQEILPPSHISSFFASDDQSYIFDARLTGQYSLSPNFRRLVILADQDIRIRMINALSVPVRTPSYNLGFNVRWRLQIPSSTVTYREVGIYHHSNGQDGFVWNSDSTNTDLLNVVDGSFSTSYFKIGLGKIKPFGDGQTQWNWNLNFEWHPVFLSFDNDSDDHPDMDLSIRDIIGTSRINFQWNYSIRNNPRAGLLSLLVDANMVLNKKDASFTSTFNAEVTIYKMFGETNFGALMSVGWLGHDYYNIYFNKPKSTFRLGFCFKH